MADTVTLTRIQPPDRIIIEPDGRVAIETPPVELQDGTGKTLGLEGKKHRREIAPEQDIDAELDVIEGATNQSYGDRKAIKRIFKEARQTERLARRVVPEGEAPAPRPGRS